MHPPNRDDGDVQPTKVHTYIMNDFLRNPHFSQTRISYRNGWNTEALIFENLKPVEITKKIFQHHLNILKNV